jgi:CDP-4-dehydro-6-deoxyglucose reductase, E1
VINIDAIEKANTYVKPPKDKHPAKSLAIRKKISALVAEFAALQYEEQSFEGNNDVIPPSGKVIDGDELDHMVQASLDGWLTTGRFNAAFESRLAQYLGIKYVLTTNSGSSANLLAFMALTSPKLGQRAIQPGDEVITVAGGFPTTVNPVLQFGAVPVFVDIDLATHNIDGSKIEAAISPKTKAIMLAHSLGNPFDLNTVKAICEQHQLWLIEDCCDALGAAYNGQLVGTFGDIATLSFYPAHHITMGEGGAVLTNNPKLKSIAESFRDWGRDCYCSPGKDNSCGKRFCQQIGDLPQGYDHKYTYSHLGYNLKITDMQAACALAQMDKLDQFIATRRANFAYLKTKLKSCSEYILLPEATENSNPSWFGFLMTLKPEAQTNRVDMIDYLDQHKIGTRLFFAGNLTKQPYMKDWQYRVSGELSNTDNAMLNSFWVGIYPGISIEMLDFIAEKIQLFFGVGFDD